MGTVDLFHRISLGSYEKLVITLLILVLFFSPEKNDLLSKSLNTILSFSPSMKIHNKVGRLLNKQVDSKQYLPQTYELCAYLTL